MPYYKSNLSYVVDDYKKEYGYIFDGERTRESTFILFENVVWEGKEYRILRRFFFELERGQISGVRMYRCLIIPEDEKNDYATLFDNSNGEIAVSRTENPYEWFCTSRYELPNMENYYVHESVAPALREEKDDEQKLICKWCKLLDESVRYYSKEAVTIRSVFGQYPVAPIPEIVKYDVPYAEDHGDYVVMRSFDNREENTYEKRRWIYSVKNRESILLVDYWGNWKDYSNEDGYAFKDDEFIKARPVLEQSMIGKMGVYQYLENVDNVFRHDTKKAHYYLTAILEKPIVESLLKVGLEQLIPDVVSNNIVIRPREKTLWQKLVLSKENFQFLLEEKLGADDMKKLQEINSMDSAVDRKAFYKWQEQFFSADAYHLNLIHEKTGLHLKEMIEYIESTYYTQGCDCVDAVQLWNDYISMFHEYFDRGPKGEELYPDSLKKAHDVLAMQNNKWLLQQNSVGRSFREINEKWQKLEYESGDFLIVLPKNSREVVLEGQALHHCVGTYVKDIVNGNCLILFIRRKGKEEKPFFTMEYDLQGSIRQIKGMSNHTISDLSGIDLKLKETLERFLMKWGKKNKIDVGIQPDREAV